MEEDETTVHVLLKRMGVSDQLKAPLGSPATLLEALDDLNGLFGCWRKLG